MASSRTSPAERMEAARRHTACRHRPRWERTANVVWGFGAHRLGAQCSGLRLSDLRFRWVSPLTKQDCGVVPGEGVRGIEGRGTLIGCQGLFLALQPRQGV